MKNLVNNKFKRFLTPSEINAVMFSLSKKIGFKTEKVGNSSEGRPIFMSTIGTGKFKVLIVGFPHPNEPIGGTLGVYCALNNKILDELDSTIYFLHALEVDSAKKNVGWIKSQFSISSYISHSYIESIDDQAEFCFPSVIGQGAYKTESSLLIHLFNTIKPDLYCPLHSSPTIGGAQFYLSKCDFGLIMNLKEIVDAYGIYIDTVPKGFDLYTYAPGFYGLYSYSNLPVRYSILRETSYQYFRKLIKKHSIAFEIPFATSNNLSSVPVGISHSDLIEEFNSILPIYITLCNNLVGTYCSENSKVLTSLNFWSENWKFSKLRPRTGKATYKDIAELCNLYFLERLLIGWWVKYLESNNISTTHTQNLKDFNYILHNVFSKYESFIKVISIKDQIEVYMQCLIQSIMHFSHNS